MSEIICIGIPVYNGSMYLRRALDSLLAQTHSNFHIVVLDDGSSDDSYSILEEYAKSDKRIALYRNDTRAGMIAAWNRVAKLAYELFNPVYFAWFSDHDWVDENWLSSLYQALKDNPDTVIAHPLTSLADADGNAVDREGFPLDTTSMTPLDALRSVTLDFFGACDVIYGLFRAVVLQAIGFLPHEIMPDRLVISEACLHGFIRYVPSACRYRRNLSPENYSDVMIDRQLSSLFAAASERPQTPLLSHSTYFVRRFIETDGQTQSAQERLLQLIQSLLYFQRQYNKFSDQLELELKEIHANHVLQPYSDLLTLVIEDKWIPITYDDQMRLHDYKRQSKELRKRGVEVKERLSQAKARVTELLRQRDELRQELLECKEIVRHPLRAVLAYAKRKGWTVRSK